MLALCDQDTRFRFVNTPYAARFGMVASEVIGRSMAEVLGVEAAARLAPHVAKVLTGEPVEFEAELPYERGGTRFVRAAYTPRVDGQGVAVGFLAAIVDITDRYQAEQALRESEARLRRAQEAASLGTWEWDLTSGKLVWSEGIYKLLGLTSRPEPSVDLWKGMIFPDDQVEVTARLQNILELEVEFTLEFRVVTDHGVRWIASIGRVERDDAGQALRLSGVNIDITERARVAQALRLSEARKTAVLETSLDAVIMMDAGGAVVDFNPAAERIFGFKRSEVFGREMASLIIPPELREAHRRGLQRHLAGAPGPVLSGRLELSAMRKDGARFPVELTITRSDVGGVVLFTGYIRDITERRRAQDRDTLLLALEDATRALDDPGQITQDAARLLGEHLKVNRCAYADVEDDQNTFNLTGDYNNGVRSIVGRYTFDQFGVECLRLMRRNQPYVVHDSETDARCTEVLGSYRLTEIRSVICVPLHKGGRFVAAMAVHATSPRAWRDDEVELVQTVAARCWESIERARVARDLRASEDRYRAFIANSSEGIWRLELDPPLDTALPIAQQVDHVYRHARFAECNDVMARMYGLGSPADLIGKGLEMMLPPTDPQARDYIQFVLESGYRLVDVESEERDAQGNTVYFSNSMVGVVENGLLLRVWGTQRDITSRRAAEAELARYRDRLELMVQERTLQLETASKRLRDSERLASLGTLAAGLGHDLHNALLPLRVHVEELESESSDSKVRQNASAISAVVGYLSELSRGMRMIAMDPAQEGPGATDPMQWQADAGRIFQSAVGRGIEVTTTARPGCPALAIAPHRLTQAVFNLVQNARDAVYLARGETGGGRIDIELRGQRGGELVEVGVRDNGPGMTEEVRRHCMEPFFTTRTRTAGRNGAGTGMGLSIVAGIVAAAGGRVEVDSTPGQGATFRLLIPGVRAEGGAQPADRPRAVVRVQDLRHRAFVAAVLASSGWEVDTTDDGADGEALLLVADSACATPEQLRQFAQPPRRALVLGVEPEDHRFEGAGVTIHRRGQPLAEVRSLVRQLTGPSRA
jgi:PAS domain S-box-containing protein